MPIVRRRSVSAAAVCLVLLLAPHVARAAPCWPPPVLAPVVVPFRAPVCRWCAGHRGIEFGTSPGTVVTAVAAGTVTFSGTVAGTAYVVVRHADGTRVTYGELATRAVRAGSVVVAGMRIGTTVGHLYFGVRIGDGDTERYVDPAPYLGTWRGVVRLVPADGSAAPPSPTARVVCATPARAVAARPAPSRGIVNRRS